jgi:hypothetical protein
VSVEALSAARSEPTAKSRSRRGSGNRYVVGGRVFLDAEGIASEAGLSRSGVLRLARLGRVPFYCVGRRWLFSPDEFMDALRRGPRLNNLDEEVDP